MPKTPHPTTGPLSVGARDAVETLGRLARMTLNMESELALAFRSHSSALARARADLKTLAVQLVRLDRTARLAAGEQRQDEKQQQAGQKKTWRSGESFRKPSAADAAEKAGRATEPSRLVPAWLG